MARPFKYHHDVRMRGKRWKTTLFVVLMVTIFVCIYLRIVYVVGGGSTWGGGLRMNRGGEKYEELVGVGEDAVKMGRSSAGHLVTRRHPDEAAGRTRDGTGGESGRIIASGVAVGEDITITDPSGTKKTSKDRGLPSPHLQRLPPPPPPPPPSEPEDGLCKEGIVALTYATHSGKDDKFCRAVESAIQHGVPLRILGWGEEWKGLTQKVRKSGQLLATALLRFSMATKLAPYTRHPSLPPPPARGFPQGTSKFASKLHCCFH